MKNQRVKFLGSLIVGLALLVLSSPVFAAAPAGKMSTDALIKEARKAVALAGEGLKEGKIDTKQKAVVPFARSLKAVNDTVKLAHTQFSKKDKAFAKTLTKASQEVRTLEVTFSRSGIKNEKVAKGVKSVNETILVLQRETLVEGVKKSGSDPKALEQSKVQYTKLQASTKSAAEELGKLRNKLHADKKADPALVKTVDHLYTESNKTAKSTFSGESMADALLLIADLAGLFDGWTYYVDPAYTVYWTAIQAPVHQSEVWLYSTTDYYTVDWAYYEVEINVPSDYDVLTVSDADIEIYDTYVDTTYAGTDFDVDAEDIGDYSADDVAATDDADYLEDEVMEEEVGDLDSTDEVADEADTEHDDAAADDATDEHADADDAEEHADADEDSADDAAEVDSADDQEEEESASNDDGGAEVEEASDEGDSGDSDAGDSGDSGGDEES